MADWKATKGAGPWPFEKQGEKCGYVNNPRWTGSPVPPSRTMAQAPDGDHEPCGYWPKSESVPSAPANLYGLTTTGTEIWATYYDGQALHWVGSYDSPIDANGLALYNGNLITVAGVGATAVIREVSTAPPLSLVADHTVLLTDDLPSMTQHTTILYVAESRKYFIVGASTHGRIIRLSQTLTREARGVYGTVITGTDGHLYLLHGTNFSWNNAYKPVTGASWSIFWTRINDDVCDSPITAWGVDPRNPTYSGNVSAIYHNGYLYLSIGQSVNLQALRKIDPSTLAIVASTNLLFAGKIIGYGDRIYVLVGITNARVLAFRASDLVQVADSGILSYGKVDSGVGNGDLVVIDGRLIVTSIPYISNSALYALDLATLAVLDAVTYSPGSGGPIYPCLARIDDTTAVIAENNGVGIARLNGLRVPTGKTELLEQVDPAYLSFGKYDYTGNGQQWVLVQPTGGTSHSQSTRCGTSPVWPMPV